MRISRSAYCVLLMLLLAPFGLISAAEGDENKTTNKHWSLQPIIRPSLPKVRDAAWTFNAIDRFVLSRLETEEVAPSPEADGVTLIRRLSLDLIGLLPTPAEVDAFLADDRPGAYERLVDRLLASPRYGERWARPWMDLCHYGDTDGFLTDQLRPYAWRYRDWLIDALNADLPFDQFTIEQLAGDLLPDAGTEQKIATGFLRQTLSNREGGAEPEEFRVLQVIDRTSMMGTIWLGLTVGCARCHDHKYDPISQREFYQLYAIFDNADEVNINAPLPGEAEPYLAKLPAYQRRRGELIAPVKAELSELQRRWELRLLEAYEYPAQDAHWDRQWELLGLIWGGGLGEGQLEGVEIVKLDPAKRTEQQQADLLDYFLDHSGDIDVDKFSELKLGELSGELKKLKAELPTISRAPTMRAAQTPRTSYVHERGDFRDRGETVQPRGPNCLPPIDIERSNPRLALARWLVSPDNPLTARVTVNRIWQELFGRGIVRTAEDFGVQGELPSHAELLDWLASEMMAQGWSIKAVHRMIVTSATYRQSSRPRPELFQRDPHNGWLARQNSLRVSAEAVRDVSLSASGLLSQKIGGPGVMPPQPARVVMEAFDNKEWLVSTGEDRYRRAVYTFIIRTAPFAQTAIFDAPNPGEVCTRRERSNTPLQSLALLNDEVFFEAAQALAAKILRESGGDLEAGIDLGFRLCLSRSPTAREHARLIELYQQHHAALSSDPESARAMLTASHTDGFDPVDAAAWTGLSSVLLNLHEFITRD